MKGLHSMNMNQSLSPLLAILLTGGTIVGTAASSAQANDPVEPATGDESENPLDSASKPGFVFSARVTGTSTADTDFDDEIGQFQYNALIAGLNAKRKIGDSSSLNIDLDAGWYSYDITPSASSVAGDAASIGSEFDDVTTLSLITTLSHQYNDTGSWFVGGGVLVGLENGADFGDSVDGIIVGGFRHKVNDQLEVGLGVYARTRLDDDVLIVPLPQIKYTIDEYWSIESQGAGAKINYHATDALDYGIYGQYESTTFRLDDTHSFAADGMVTQRSFPIGFYAQYQPNDTIHITGRVGGLLAMELEILDTNGNEVATQDIDTGIFGSLSVSFAF